MAIDGVAGVTATETNVAAVIVNVVDPVTPLSVAEIELVPTPAPEARPFEPLALLIVAFDVSLDAQVAVRVRFCVDASV